jgi:hypothetical protein
MSTIDAVAVTPAEMAERDSWFAAKFQGVAPQERAPARLVTLANQWGPIRLNRSAVGRSLNIAGREYAGGLNCHAVSRVSVRLPAPARAFSAIVGVDSNPEWTIPGKGNLVFAVKRGERELWRSPVLREGMPGVPLGVPLAGATEFHLEVRDGGEGIDYGQGDWAEARAKSLRQGQLPFERIGPGRPISFDRHALGHDGGGLGPRADSRGLAGDAGGGAERRRHRLL